MTEKSISEQLREIANDSAHDAYLPLDEVGRILDLADKVEALERELERVKYQRDSAYRYIDDLEEEADND